MTAAGGVLLQTVNEAMRRTPKHTSRKLQEQIRGKDARRDVDSC